MRLDPEVARRKFAREVERVEAQRALLRRWGCWIVDVAYPHVDVVFAPRKSARLSLSVDPDRAKGRVRQARRKPRLIPVDLPMIAARTLGVRIDMSDFDRLAPGVSFHDPCTWEPLPYIQLPFGQNIDEHGKALRVVLDVHPRRGGPFLCMRGVREYHEHPQHTGDDWALYRGYHGLFAVLRTIWLTCIEQAQPHIILMRDHGVRVQWEAEVVA